MESNSSFKELVEYIVTSLVDNPDQVTVNESEQHDMIVLEINVATSDMGRVIGKGGRVVNSIRTLVQVLAAKQGKRVSLEVL
ncbi:MAG: KH domain-containing protein [Candidatus Promineifilaceae bacterium]